MISDTPGLADASSSEEDLSAVSTNEERKVRHVHDLGVRIGYY